MNRINNISSSRDAQVVDLLMKYSQRKWPSTVALYIYSLLNVTQINTITSSSGSFSEAARTDWSFVPTPPKFDPIGMKFIDEGQLLSFNVFATDINSGDVLAYNTSVLPSGANFDSSTQTFSWDPWSRICRYI